MRCKNWMKKKKRKRKKRGKQNVVAQIFLIKLPMTFVFPLIFSPDFSLIWLDCILVGPERKHSNSTKFSSHFLSQPNNAKVIFSHIFFSFFSSSSKSPQPNGLLLVEFVLGCYVKKNFKEGVCQDFLVSDNSRTNLIIILHILVCNKHG